MLKDLLKNLIENKVKKYLLVKVVIPVVAFIVIVFLVISIPLFVVYEIKEKFDGWFDGKSGQYSSTNEAVLAWLNTVGDDVLVDDDTYIKKADIQKYIKAEPKTYFPDVDMTVIENINVQSFNSFDGSTTNYDSTESHAYTMKTRDATAKYKLPWQTMVILNSTHNGAVGTTEDNEKDILDLFGTKYFGMFEGQENVPVSLGQMTSVAPYKYYKTVKKTIKTVQEFYVSVPDGNGGSVQAGPFYLTTITTRIIKYPLPYFSSITTMTSNYEFNYKDKLTTKHETYGDKSYMMYITTETTIPTQTDEDELDIDRFASNLASFNINPFDVEYMTEQIRVLPGGESAVSILDYIKGQMYDFNNFDFYYGAETGNGKFKLSGQGQFAWPLANPTVNITSGFGNRIHPTLLEQKFHNGIDIGVASGTPVYAASDGEILFAGDAGTYGFLVKVRHDGGLETRYAHLTRPLVKEGDFVTKGMVIALSGNTGRSTGPHLHFEVRLNGNPVDPGPYLGLVPDIPDFKDEDFQFREVDAIRLKAYLNGRNSVLARDPYTTQFIEAARASNVNPLILFAITGQEMSYVKNSTDYWINIYSRDRLEKKIASVLKLHRDYRTPEEILRGNLVPQFIANNPFNVFHSWWEYNTDTEDAAAVACRTLKNLGKDCPPGHNLLYWINTRGGRGGYAEDKNWWIGVSRNFEALKEACGQ